MADLTVCYFCGTTADVREQPVIPEELGPTERHQRTVAVCPSCGEKLSAALEPLVAHVTAAWTPSHAETDTGRKEPADADPATAMADTGSTSTTEDAPPEDRAGEAGSGDTAPTAGGPQASMAAEQAEFPDGTKQVLRLLQNRERPIDREGLVDLATNAYGLEYPQAQDVLETLLDRGVLAADEDGTVSIARD